MTPMQKIAAYQELLSGIKATMDRVDGQITTLIAEYENLKKMYEAVSGDLVATASSMDSSATRS